MIAALYPGQGSQFVGMGEFLFNQFPLYRQRVEQASDALNINFRNLLFNGPEEALQLTENTQPAILLTSVAFFDVLQQTLEFNPSVAAGHSIGEYAALVNAGCIDFEDAICLVQKRGQFMQQATPAGVGGMLALLGLTHLQAKFVANWAQQHTGKVVEPANYNAPGQVVLSGDKKSLDWLVTNFTPKILAELPEGHNRLTRYKFIPLKVSAPFHCSLMQPAEDKMRLLIETTSFNSPTHNVIQNFKAQSHLELSEIKESLIRQISAPVLWTQCVEHLACEKAIEVGAGQVIKGLVKKISKQIEVFNLSSLEDLKILEASFK